MKIVPQRNLEISLEISLEIIHVIITGILKLLETQK